MLFQSTLSVRRATIVVFGVVKEHVISIHALRKESDLLDLIRYFGIAKTISIHALRKESDDGLIFVDLSSFHFNPRSP